MYKIHYYCQQACVTEQPSDFLSILDIKEQFEEKDKQKEMSRKDENQSLTSTNIEIKSPAICHKRRSPTAAGHERPSPADASHEMSSLASTSCM